MFKILKFLLVLILVSGVGLAQAKDMWYCPMHPHYTSDKPGNCPICAMKLVKKQDNPEGEMSQMLAQQKNGVPGYGVVLLNQPLEQVMGIKTIPVGRAALIKKVRAPGYVSTEHDLFEFQEALIQARIDYAAIYRNYKRFKHTRRNWEPHRQLQVKLHAAKDMLLRLGLGFEEIEKLETVDWRKSWKQPELLFLKEDMGYWVVAQVYEADRGFLAVGQTADIEIPSYHEHAKGVIRSIGGVFDLSGRTVNTLIELTGYRGELEGNMFVKVTFPVTLEGSSALMVPATAVMDTGTRKLVYVQVKPGLFEPREIQVITAGDNGWAVKSGLSQGDRVAVEGNFLLDSESRLQGALSTVEGGTSHGR